MEGGVGGRSAAIVHSSLTDLFQSDPQISLIMSMTKTKAEGNYAFHKQSTRGAAADRDFHSVSTLCPVAMFFPALSFSQQSLSVFGPATLAWFCRE